MHLKKILFFAVLLLALTGCNTIDHRIHEKQDAFNRLDPQTQAKIRQARIEIGYTPEMVYIVLGKPDKISGSTWFYKTFYEEGDQERPLYVVRYEKDYTIPFKDGRVTDGLSITINGIKFPW